MFLLTGTGSVLCCSCNMCLMTCCWVLSAIFWEAFCSSECSVRVLTDWVRFKHMRGDIVVRAVLEYVCVAEMRLSLCVCEGVFVCVAAWNTHTHTPSTPAMCLAAVSNICAVYLLWMSDSVVLIDNVYHVIISVSEAFTVLSVSDSHQPCLTLCCLTMPRFALLCVALLPCLAWLRCLVTLLLLLLTCVSVISDDCMTSVNRHESWLCWAVCICHQWWLYDGCQLSWVPILSETSTDSKAHLLTAQFIDNNIRFSEFHQNDWQVARL